jgi:hypothetical protein
LKKSIKLLITLGLVLGMIGALVLLKYISSIETNPTTISATPDWNTFNSPEGGLSLESPFPMKWETDEHVTNRSGYKTIHGRSLNNSSGFTVSVNYTQFINSQTDSASYLEETEIAVKNIFQNYKNSQWTDQVTTCSGMPATLSNYSFDMAANRAFFTDYMVANKDQFWKIQTKSEKSMNNYNEWSKRVMGSIKIALPKP